MVSFCMFVCIGVGRNFSKGVATSGFFQTFLLGGVKSGEICFLPLEAKKTAFFAEFFKLLPLFRHACLCVGKFVQHY